MAAVAVAYPRDARHNGSGGTIAIRALLACRRPCREKLAMRWLSLHIGIFVATFLFTAATVRPVAAQDAPGLAQLDEATQLKISAKTFDDLGNVVELAEKAIDKGLSDADKKFALQLITSSLLQRATAVSEAIFGRTPPDPRWPQLRKLAMNDMERALKNDPNFAAGHLLIGRLEGMPGGDRERAKKSFDEAIRLSEGDEAKAEAYLARANFEEDPDKQLADFNEAVKLAPQSADAIRARGLYYFGRGKNEEALADLDAAIKLRPDDVESHEARGVALLVLKRFDDAIAAFDKALSIAPRTPGLLTNRARVYALKEDFDKAMKDLGDALSINRNDVGALLLRARVYQAQQKFDEAMEDVNRLLRVRPGLIAAIELRAGLNAAQGNFKEAIDDLELLRRDDPSDIERLLQLGVIYNAAKRPRKAIEVFEDVLKKNPGNWNAHYGRGDALLSIGKHVEAVADYEAALKAQPEHSGVLNNLAWVLATSPMDNVRNAKRSIELGTKACEVTKYQRPHILSTLAAGYAEAGDWENAVKWSQKSLDVAEDDDENRPQLEKELQSYKEKKPWRELQNEDEDAPKDSKPDEPKREEPKPESPKSPEP
jgi:tetratricopeptide (TPR) repeat protein